MKTSVNCPACSHSIDVEPPDAERDLKCPVCRSPFQVPLSSAAIASSSHVARESHYPVDMEHELTSISARRTMSAWVGGIILVIVILGVAFVLVALMALNFGARGQPYSDITKRQLRSFASMIETHRLDTGMRPKSLESLHSNTEGLHDWNGPYAKEPIPTDAWNSDYGYDETRIWSFGPDCVNGTADDIVFELLTH